MRNNSILAAAIAVTLASINGVYAMEMENYSPNCGANTCTDPITLTNGDDDAAATITALSVIPDDGITYGSHLFGDSTLTLPDSAKAIIAFKVDGSINFAVNFNVQLTNGAEFGSDGADLYYVVGTDTDGNTNNSGTVTIDGGDDCDGQSECSWSIGVADDGSGNDKILDNDKFYLVYDLDSVQALETPGEIIEMTADVGSSLQGNVAVGLSVTVAQSDDPLTVTMQTATESTTRISVASGSTEFTSTNSATIEQISANEAVFGYIKIENNDDVVAADGYTPWSIGNTDTSAGGHDSFSVGFDEDGNETTLIITSGQFNASITDSSGGVYIYVPGHEDGDISSDTDEIDASTVTSTDATWELSDADLKNIAAASTNESNRGPAIVIKTDGTNTVNIEENPPEATLTIDYLDGQKDIIYPTTELTAFRQDGTTCWVYNVPPPSTEGVADTLNLRITNDSSGVSGTVLGTMYPMGGDSTGLTNPIFSSINLLGGETELGAYQTVRITADDISALGGDTPYTWWETGNRRGSLYISSTLPKLEILVLVRDAQKGVLTNISTGAHGVACEN